jgi:hypothetical protein
MIRTYVLGVVCWCLATPVSFSAYAATVEVLRPKECHDAMALEMARERRIEAEFRRRGIFNQAEKHFHRPEIEREIDDLIRMLKEACDRIRSQTGM